MRIIDTHLLDTVSAEAKGSPRLRKNHNFHPADDSPCHRLLNAMEPDSYIRPHCHASPLKDESIVVVRGRLGVAAFDGAGVVVMTRILAAGGDAVAVDIPHGEFHTVVALEHGTVFFEAKAGPYAPLAETEKASWAPDEATSGAPSYLAWLKGLFS